MLRPLVLKQQGEGSFDAPASTITAPIKRIGRTILAKIIEVIGALLQLKSSHAMADGEVRFEIGSRHLGDEPHPRKYLPMDWTGGAR